MIRIRRWLQTDHDTSVCGARQAECKGWWNRDSQRGHLEFAESDATLPCEGVVHQLMHMDLHV